MFRRKWPFGRLDVTFGKFSRKQEEILKEIQSKQQSMYECFGKVCSNIQSKHAFGKVFQVQPRSGVGWDTAGVAICTNHVEQFEDRGGGGHVSWGGDGLMSSNEVVGGSMEGEEAKAEAINVSGMESSRIEPTEASLVEQTESPRIEPTWASPVEPKGKNVGKSMEREEAKHGAISSSGMESPRIEPTEASPVEPKGGRKLEPKGTPCPMLELMPPSLRPPITCPNPECGLVMSRDGVKEPLNYCPLCGAMLPQGCA